jgi:hypothetical protein
VLLEGFLKLVRGKYSIFIEARQDFIFHFLHNKAAEKLKNQWVCRWFRFAQLAKGKKFRP